MRPRRLPGLLAGGALVVCALILLDPAWSPYGAIAGVLLGVKVLASHKHATPRTWFDLTADERASFAACRIAVVVPFYNEDPEALAAMARSLSGQALRPDVVCLVNDGSSERIDSTRLDYALELFGSEHIELVVLDRRWNRGKRESLAEGIRHPALADVDFIVTVDSDTVLDRAAIANALVALEADEQAAAVTGMIRVQNWHANLLTRLQDVRYTQSFLTDRAAYSLAGSVLCVCGSFTMWRGPVLRDLLDDFLTQEFMGRRATYGDDRHLTNLALRLGYRIRFTPTALADTLAPERVGHFVRQQVRWSKSFLRESFWAVTRLPLGRAFALSFFELFSWWALTILLLLALVAGVVHFAALGGALVAWVALTSLLRSVRYLDTHRRDQSLVERLIAFALAPLYGVFHFVVILPIKVWAFATLFDTRWGSRRRIEVRAS